MASTQQTKKATLRAIPMTLYLHITPDCNFVFTKNAKYNADEVTEILDQLSKMHEKHLKLNPRSTLTPSPLDIKFFNKAKITLKFGRSMKNWTFWKNQNPRFCTGKNQAISISNEGIAGKGWFEDKHIKTTARQVTFMYTGQDGTNRKPLKCEYDLCIKNTVKTNTTKLETKIIIDPVGKNNGKWP